MKKFSRRPSSSNHYTRVQVGVTNAKCEAFKESSSAAIAGLVIALFLWLCSFCPGGKIAFDEFVDHVSFVHPVLITTMLLLPCVYLAADGATIKPFFRWIFQPLIGFFGHLFGIGAGANLALIPLTFLLKDYVPIGLHIAVSLIYSVVSFLASLSAYTDRHNDKFKATLNETIVFFVLASFAAIGFGGSMTDNRTAREFTCGVYGDTVHVQCSEETSRSRQVETASQQASGAPLAVTASSLNRSTTTDEASDSLLHDERPLVLASWGLVIATIIFGTIQATDLKHLVKSVFSAVRSSRAGDIPYLIREDKWIPKFGEPKLGFSFGNHGRTPALIKETYAIAHYGAALPAQPDYESGYRRNYLRDRIVERGAEIRVEMGPHYLAPTAAAEALPPTHWVYGYIKYRDIYLVHHTKGFCYRLQVPHPFEPVPQEITDEHWIQGDDPQYVYDDPEPFPVEEMLEH